MIELQLGNLTQDKKLLIFSDLHIGDPRVDPHNLGLICNAIRRERPDVLVLDGDILEENLASSGEKKRLASYCEAIPRVVVLKGNHDTKPTRQLAYSIEATFGECLTGYCGGKSYAIEHGNRFDSWWRKFPGVGRLSIWLNRAIYRITKFDLQGWLRGFKSVEKKLKKQHKKAWKAWSDSHDIVISGHTHYPVGSVFGDGYFNSGDWLYHRSYVVLDNGGARLEHVQ